MKIVKNRGKSYKKGWKIEGKGYKIFKNLKNWLVENWFGPTSERGEGRERKREKDREKGRERERGREGERERENFPFSMRA